MTRDRTEVPASAEAGLVRVIQLPGGVGHVTLLYYLLLTNLS
jgi:hypothetical protein